LKDYPNYLNHRKEKEIEKMKNRLLYRVVLLVVFSQLIWGCKSLKQIDRIENPNTPTAYSSNIDTNNIATLKWKYYFKDKQLIDLIDTALSSNQELNIILQEIEINRNEIKLRKGEYLPFVSLGLSSGFERSAKYTRNGAVDDQLEIKQGKTFPTPLQNYFVGAVGSWEIDIWKKLRNTKASAVSRYLAGVEGRNFLVTQLIAEISQAYYELMALDNLLGIIESNITIQTSAFNVVKQQKDAARVTQLAVNRFEAQLLNTQNLQYGIKQKIIETENKINFLTGRFPKPILRNSSNFLSIKLDSIQEGIPAQLLKNRPDIKKAEKELAAAKLDIKVARANFYPSLSISTGIGFQSFNPSFLINPVSLLYNLAGDLVAPLINRNSIKANYRTANNKQIQAVINYEKTVLNAYVDVLNQLAKVDNYTKSFETKNKEVDILNQSIVIANSLFFSARADYAEVLLTQREALDAKIELIEIKLKQLDGKTNIYRALGGGWN